MKRDSFQMVEPLPVTILARNPGPWFGIGKRIEATLLGMVPGSDQSFVVDCNRTAHDVAKRLGIRIRTSRKNQGGKCRVWRVA